MHAQHYASCKGVHIPWWAGLHIGLKRVVTIMNLLMYVLFGTVKKLHIVPWLCATVLWVTAMINSTTVLYRAQLTSLVFVVVVPQTIASKIQHQYKCTILCKHCYVITYTWIRVPNLCLNGVSQAFHSMVAYCRIYITCKT